MKNFARTGYILGAIMTVFIFMMLTIDGRESWHTTGPANPGHQDLECTDCHTEAPGTVRQQLQANIKAALGLRESGVAFGHEAVTNENCRICHDRPNDNHPVFRFNESRFVDARKAIAPQFCASCHQEHLGQRVSIDATFCVHCHTDLEIANDPLDVPHTELVAEEDWASCMGCHDFHGNHDRITPASLDDMIDQSAIESYFMMGNSPYSDRTFYQAKEHIND